MTLGNTILKMSDINISFSGVQVLFNANFELKSGEINCLIGENGAGKSTLVKILSGVYPEYTGTVEIDGKQVMIGNPIISKQLGIHSIQQHRDLVPTLSAVENIFLGEMTVNGIFIDIKEMKKRARSLLSQFGIEIDIDVPVRELKVSEQGIVTICKALVSECKILLVDEASAPLDNNERSILYDILRTLKNQEKGIVYITHHMEEIAKIGDTITVLRGGETVAVIKEPDTEMSVLINLMTGEKKIYNRANVIEREIRENEIPILEVERVSNAFLNDISFKVYKGEIIGFAGLEGCNKHLIAETIFGLCSYSTGEIKIRGEIKRYKHPIEAIRDRIGYLPTDRKVNGLIGCRDIVNNIMLTSVNAGKKEILNLKKMRADSDELTKELRVKMASLDQLIVYLSGGNQQKILLGKWLLADVDILFLNGPTEGIDVGARMDIYSELNKLALEGKTLILFSSDIDELLTLCNRIFTLSEGLLVGEYIGTTAEKSVILTDMLTKQQNT